MNKKRSLLRAALLCSAAWAAAGAPRALAADLDISITANADQTLSFTKPDGSSADPLVAKRSDRISWLSPTVPNNETLVLYGVYFKETPFDQGGKDDSGGIGPSKFAKKVKSRAAKKEYKYEVVVITRDQANNVKAYYVDPRIVIE